MGRGLCFLVSMVLVLAGCASSPGGSAAWRTSDIDLFWPSPPDAARIQFLRALHGPVDFRDEKQSSKLVRWLFSEQEDDTPLLNPFAIAADGEGRVWVADTGAHLIHVFDLERRRIDYIQEIDRQPLDYPVGLAIDAQRQRLYVADASQDRIYVLDYNGTLVSEWQPPGGFRRPAGMAVGRTGNLYVADALAGEVVVFSPEGQFLQRFGSNQTANGKFVRPVSLAIGPKEELLVVDAMSFRIEVLLADGSAGGMIGRLGDSAGFFARPKGVAVSPEGYVYVSDSAFDNIQVFDMTGNLLMFFGGPGRAEGSFSLPAGLFLDEKGRLYVADPYNQRVQVFQTIQPE